MIQLLLTQKAISEIRRKTEKLQVELKIDVAFCELWKPKQKREIYRILKAEVKEMLAV